MCMGCDESVGGPFVDRNSAKVLSIVIKDELERGGASVEEPEFIFAQG